MATQSVSAAKSGGKSRPRKKKIIFVCTGNTCRSPMAEHIFRYILRKKRKLSLYDVSSAGLSADEGAPMTDHARTALEKLGVRVRRKHAARQLTPLMAEQADFIVCMTQAHKYELRDFGDKVKTVGELTGGPDVPDPYMGSLEVYLRTAEYLLYASEDIFTALSRL